MTDTSDKAIEAIAAAPWAYASADLSAMLIALQAERKDEHRLAADMMLRLITLTAFSPPSPHPRRPSHDDTR